MNVTRISRTTTNWSSTSTTGGTSTLLRYVWAVLAIVALMVTGAVIYTNRQPRIYEANASVQIEPRIPDLLGQGQEELLRGGGGDR